MIQVRPCPICKANAKVLAEDMHIFTAYECEACQRFRITGSAQDDNQHIEPRERALASYLIANMQGQRPPFIDQQFFDNLRKHSLPAPADLCDNVLIYIAKSNDGAPGGTFPNSDLSLRHVIAKVGGRTNADTDWALTALVSRGLLAAWKGDLNNCTITVDGWQRIEELRKAHASSRYAFFARQFENADLDSLYTTCLVPTVKSTGYDLLPVSQKAGPIDAIIEDEIRRCRFLLADLSDDNAGAYWEAGFAEGLGKPVIYLCRKGKSSHFDTNHRHTVFWDLAEVSNTMRMLKAVIRNTLLGDAIQVD